MASPRLEAWRAQKQQRRQQWTPFRFLIAMLPLAPLSYRCPATEDKRLRSKSQVTKSSLCCSGAFVTVTGTTVSTVTKAFSYFLLTDYTPWDLFS